MSFKYSKNWTKDRIIKEASKECSSLYSELSDFKKVNKTLHEILEDKNNEIDALKNMLIDSQRQISDIKIERSSYLNLLLKLFEK